MHVVCNKNCLLFVILDFVWRWLSDKMWLNPRSLFIIVVAITLRILGKSFDDVKIQPRDEYSCIMLCWCVTCTVTVRFIYIWTQLTCSECQVLPYVSIDIRPLKHGTAVTRPAVCFFSVMAFILVLVFSYWFCFSYSFNTISFFTFIMSYYHKHFFNQNTRYAVKVNRTDQLQLYGHLTVLNYQ